MLTYEQVGAHIFGAEMFFKTSACIKIPFTFAAFGGQFTGVNDILTFYIFFIFKQFESHFCLILNSRLLLH